VAGRTDALSEGPDPTVVPLGKEPIPEPPPPVTPPSRLHGLSIALMATSALVGIVATFLFVTVTWPGDTGRYVGATIFLSVVGFVTGAAIAIFTAARDTYVLTNGPSKTDDADA
jgi:hypothetical protein